MAWGPARDLTHHRSATVSQCPMALIREDQPPVRAPVIPPALMEGEAVVWVEV